MKQRRAQAAGGGAGRGEDALDCHAIVRLMRMVTQAVTPHQLSALAPAAGEAERQVLARFEGWQRLAVVRDEVKRADVRSFLDPLVHEQLPETIPRCRFQRMLRTGFP